MKHHQRILILDDEEALRKIIAQRLERRGYEVLEAGTGEEGLVILQNTLLDAVLLDLRLPDGDGLNLLQQIKRVEPDLQVIMLTGHGTIESAIEAMRLGAFDYLTKPCNLSELEITLQKALEQHKLLVENTGLRQVVNRQTAQLKIIAESIAMRNLLEMTKKVAKSDVPVLIQGESGVGKELIARALHVWSQRTNQSYVPLNSGAIPEQLIESELFGHEKGAFTGATGSKIGLVEIADRGTLFLDEIGETPVALQVKLLRFLETGEFRRVGDTRLRRVDVRIITATNRDLSEEINRGSFRKDLYYRLSGLTLDVPPLRDRREDIIPLAQYFLKQNQHHKYPEKAQVLSQETKYQLVHYDFPGNVRELMHLIERGQILAAGEVIEPGDIWPEKVLPSTPAILQALLLEEPPKLPDVNSYPTLEDVERDYILATLKKVNGNRIKAAKLLGISVRNLYRKIEVYRQRIK